MHADTNDTSLPAPDDDSSALSPTMRGYLATIARLASLVRRSDGFISTSELAERLNVSAPAVNRMVMKLRDLDLIQHEPYQASA